MNWLYDSIWWFVVVAGVIGSGLFSGLETGVYSLNRVRLHLLSHQSHSSGSILAGLVAKPAKLLVSLLIATNIATNIATSSLAIILHGRGLSEWQIIAIGVLVMTPVCFIFAETLPKDLFAAYADRLVYPFARVMKFLTVLFSATGIIPLFTGVSYVLMRLVNAPGEALNFEPRRQIHLLVKEGVGHGLLSDDQSAIVERILALSACTVEDEMVPWQQVISICDDESVTRLWELADQTSHTRFPVSSQSGQIKGVVDITEVLQYKSQDCPSTNQLLKPVTLLEASTTLRQGLTHLQQSSVPMAIVVRDGKPVGLVTIKDLIEPITGELASW